MKVRLTAVALIALGLAIFGHGQTQPSPIQQQGRFQIYQFDHLGSVNHSMYRNTDVFRIDTQTGETWRYTDVIPDQGMPISVWDKISEPRNVK